jgi:hypothetical protein
LNACAPKAQERQFPQPMMDFGPRNHDTDLSTSLKENELFKPSLSWQGAVPTASFFQQAENMMILGQQMGRPALTQKGLKWVESFYQSPKTSSYTDFSRSPFATLATTQTQDQVQKALGDVQNDLDHSRRLIKGTLADLGKSYVWPQSGANLQQMIVSAESFTQVVTTRIGALGIPQVVSEGVNAELKKQTSTLFADFRDLANQLYASNLFSKALRLVEGAIVKFKLQLPAETQTSLQQGRLIAKDLDGLNTPQAGLTVLIDIWNILSAKERAEYFQLENQSLYDFLAKQDAKDLSCLRLPDCNGGLFNGIAKKLFVLPKIEKYGLGELHAKLNKKTLQYMVALIEQFAQQFIVNIPQTFAQRIDAGLVGKADELVSIQKNYPDYLKTLLGKWAGKNMPGTAGKVAGFETPVVNVQLSAKNKLTLEAAASSLDLKANTAGTSMAANALFLQKTLVHNDFKMRTALSQINKLIAIGGYRDDAKHLVPALMMPIEKTQTPLDLMTFTKSSYSYRIPDRIKMLDSFRASEEPYAKDFSASAYAEQLKGLSQMLNFTADWKKTGFEEILGKVQAQELTNEIQNPALARPLFPKDMLFALNIGDAAVLLKNITKKSTPVFLITLNNKTIWADQYRSDGEETAIMAGLVDIKDGQRSTVVQGQDVAKFLLAIQEFLKATEGVERTRSSILLERDENGQTPLNALLEGRKDLKLLTVALANFISSQLLDENSLVQSTYSLKAMQKVKSENFRVEDQALAIRSLVAAWEVTGMDAYLWTAQEIYFALNKKAFSVKEHFYVNGDGSSLSFPEKVQTLRALVGLQPSLQEASQRQLGRILAPWMRGLEELP